MNLRNIKNKIKNIDEVINFNETNRVSFDIPIGYIDSSFHDIIRRGINDASGYRFFNKTLTKLYENSGELAVDILLEKGYKNIFFGNLDEIEDFIKSINPDILGTIFIMKDESKSGEYIIYSDNEYNNSAGLQNDVREEVKSVLD